MYGWARGGQANTYKGIHRAPVAYSKFVNTHEYTEKQNLRKSIENLRKFRKISGYLKKSPEIYRKSPDISIYQVYEVFLHIVVRDNPNYRPRKSPEIFHKSPEIFGNLRIFFQSSGDLV